MPDLPLDRGARLPVEHVKLRELASSSPSLFRLDHFDKEGGEAQATIFMADREVSVTITYPDGFPGIRPELKTDDPEARTFRHVTRSGLICTLRYQPDQWIPEKDTAARLLRRAWVLLELRGGLRTEEDDQGPRPLDFKIQETFPQVLVDETVAGNFLAGEGGKATLLSDSSKRYLSLTQIWDQKGASLWTSESPAKVYGSHLSEKEFAFWFHPLADPPEQLSSVDDLKNLMSPAVRRLVHTVLPNFERDKNGRFIFLMPFRDDTGERWIAAEVEQRRRHRGQHVPKIRYLETPSVGAEAYYGRLSGLVDWMGVREAHVLVIGAGALGSETAFQLHRCGVRHLTVVDPDRVGTGNPVRSEYGLRQLGQPKVEALLGRLGAHLPTDDVMGIPGRMPAQKVMDRLQDRHKELPFTSILVATGHHNLSRILDPLLHRFGVPRFYTWTTRGAAGGTVLAAGEQGSDYHTYHQLRAAGVLPNLPEDEVADQLDRGCAFPSLPAGPLDTREVANQAARAILDFEQGKAVPFIQMWTRKPFGRFPGLAWLKFERGDLQAEFLRQPVALPPIREVRIDYINVPTLERLMRDRPELETGGLLLGTLDPEEGVAHVKLVTGPGEQAIRTTHTFSMDHSYAQGWLDAAHHFDSSLRFIGEWHSHPGGCLEPSAVDEIAALKLASANGSAIDIPILLIGRLRQGELNMRVFALQPFGSLEKVAVAVLPFRPDFDNGPSHTLR